jgi:hypothetical protein
MATAAAPEPAASAQPRKLSDDLERLLQEFAAETVTLREVMAVLDGRGYVLLVMLLALPFITPIPLPGLSTPFGMVIALIGLRLSLGLKPRLPARLLDTTLAPRLFARVFAAARKVVRGFEVLLKPRLPWMTAGTRVLRFHALPIFLCGLLLLLPLPVPFSNLLPAFSILLIAAGLLERDGLFILAGHAVFAGAVVFFVFLALASAESFDAIKRWGAD